MQTGAPQKQHIEYLIIYKKDKLNVNFIIRAHFSQAHLYSKVHTY